MKITIRQSDVDLINQQGEETFPYECCGFILGSMEGGDKTVSELVPALNAREGEDQSNRFLITPENYRETDKQARKNGVDIIGFYHSHPDSPARPSEYDREHALPCYSYIIVSVMGGKHADMTSWVLKDDRASYDEERIEVVAD